MKEFKGKCEFAVTFTAMGIAFVTIAVVSLALALIYGAVAAYIGGGLFLLGGFGLFVVGLNKLIYGSKVVLKICEDHIEFIPYGKFFNYKPLSAEYAEISRLRVSPEGYYKVVKNKKKLYNKPNGSVEFILGNKYFILEVDCCREAGKIIAEKLNK